MHQTVNIKAVLESVSAPQTFKYQGKYMVIQKAVAAGKSGTTGETFYSQLVYKAEEGKSYILTSFKIHSNQNERYCVKSVQIRSYFWSIFFCIQSKYRKIWTRNNSISRHFSHSDFKTTTNCGVTRGSNAGGAICR